MKNTPINRGKGIKNRGKIPGLIEFICFVLLAAVAFYIWFDPNGPAVFIVPVMAADRKNAGRAGVLAALLEPRAAAAMLKYISNSFFASLRAAFPRMGFILVWCICRHGCRFWFIVYDKGH